MKIRASGSNQQVEEKKKETEDAGEEPVFDFDTSPQGRDRGLFGKWIYDNFVSWFFPMHSSLLIPKTFPASAQKYL